ncbi:hypothetical protein CIG75_00605 [Tumebacillus algifaecis]|uniref:Uncharacterized protein n=1 Tax=Tumebacillus algifaecis TaxID=1214604 RepID=A0A223CWX0_9BACL|nr:hypothetical protein [Tumebacillus algifaecis]ASS73623.1 hypothetical protein CIG75_00605 [Tumebacillus algifaecis]
MKEGIVMLKIHNGLKDGKSHYDAICGHWRTAAGRLKFIQYTVGINRWNFVCVFKPSIWGYVETGHEKGRKYFEGVEAPVDMLSKLQEAEVKLLQKFGRGRELAYAFLSEVE